MSCVYIANATQSMIFHAVSHFKEPYADVGKGELTASLRLSKGMQTTFANGFFVQCFVFGNNMRSLIIHNKAEKAR